MTEDQCVVGERRYHDFAGPPVPNRKNAISAAMTSARPPPVKRMPRPPWAPARRAAKLITSPPRWYISRYAWSWVDREEHERGEEDQVDLRLQPSGPPRHHGEH